MFFYKCTNTFFKFPPPKKPVKAKRNGSFHDRVTGIEYKIKINNLYPRIDVESGHVIIVSGCAYDVYLYSLAFCQGVCLINDNAFYAAFIGKCA